MFAQLDCPGKLVEAAFVFMTHVAFLGISARPRHVAEATTTKVASYA
jgi:hypothetical protein